MLPFRHIAGIGFAFTLAVALAVTLLPSNSPAFAAPGDVVTLPDSNFDKSPGPALPAGWSAYQWGPTGNKFETTLAAGAGRTGNAIRAHNIDALAKAGAYTHVKLAPGTYELTVWARADKGQMARVAIYLASAYSRTFKIGDQWTQIRFTNSVSEPIERAEINVQNASPGAGTVWFDDINLRQVDSIAYEIVPDTRKERPRTLMFSPMNVNYLRETAPDWAKRGFRGFLFDAVMASSESDVWSVDGDPKSRGDDDRLLQEVKTCNDACKKVGIDSNFVKVALYNEWPDPFDDAAWAAITKNYADGARFARLSGCAGIAIDTEYKAEQFQPTWPGYAKNGHSLPELKQKIHDRWQTIVAGMLKEYPDMVLLTLPEGIHYYGELAGDLFRGMLQAMSEAKAPGGLHVMTEGTYHITDVGGLASYAAALQDEIRDELPPQLVPYWKSRCSIALGAWPLGYYREIKDGEGKFIGWSGREETFGDKIVGSYADKSAWYPPETFATQMAGLNSFSPRYNWIYAHGATFWQWTADQKAEFVKRVHNVSSNADIPVVANLDAYFKSIRQPGLAIRKSMKRKQP